jgi:hypothetical protein
MLKNALRRIAAVVVTLMAGLWLTGCILAVDADNHDHNHGDHHEHSNNNDNNN